MYKLHVVTVQVQSKLEEVRREQLTREEAALAALSAALEGQGVSVEERERRIKEMQEEQALLALALEVEKVRALVVCWFISDSPTWFIVNVSCRRGNSQTSAPSWAPLAVNALNDRSVVCVLVSHPLLVVFAILCYTLSFKGAM